MLDALLAAYLDVRWDNLMDGAMAVRWGVYWAATTAMTLAVGMVRV